MRFHIVLAVCVSLFNISQCSLFTGNATFDNGNFAANWTYNPDTDKINFQVQVNTNGWVGFGFANQPSTNMQDYDVVVGGRFDVEGNALYVSKSCKI